jgi:hypothetical protein
VIFAYSLLAYEFQLVSAVMLALHPHESGIVDDPAFVISWCIRGGSQSAWQLLQSPAVAGADQVDTGDDIGGDNEP